MNQRHLRALGRAMRAADGGALGLRQLQAVLSRLPSRVCHPNKKARLLARAARRLAGGATSR